MGIGRKDILALYEAGPEAVIRLVETLLATIERQAEEIGELAELKRAIASLKDENEKLKRRIGELEAKLKLNSRNSSKPPSSDSFGRPAVKRKKTGKPPGGQMGHQGHTLRMVDQPDYVVTHWPQRCKACGRSLARVKAKAQERRQVFDLPPMRVEVTEHRSQIKLCPRCGCQNKAAFPEGVEAPVQYGPRIKATASYLRDYQLIPLKRASEIFSDLFGHDLCEGTLLNANRALGEILALVEEEIRRGLTQSPVLNLDETGIRVEGGTAWLHVASTERLTSYAPHPKRGREAIADMGIVPHFRGTAVHDFWRPYLAYPCRHALCNAHLLRELTYLEEEEGEKWAGNMRELLLEIHKVVDKAKSSAKEQLSPVQRSKFEKRYHQILAQGFSEKPLPDIRGQPKRRGRRKKGKARNLLERLRDYQPEVLAFMHNFTIPFDNNLAERDLRMVKVQQKVSGSFRSWEGAETFCRIRGYISTVRKNSISVIQALTEAFEGKPFIPLTAAGTAQI